MIVRYPKKTRPHNISWTKHLCIAITASVAADLSTGVGTVIVGLGWWRRRRLVFARYMPHVPKWSLKVGGWRQASSYHWRDMALSGDDALTIRAGVDEQPFIRYQKFLQAGELSPVC